MGLASGCDSQPKGKSCGSIEVYYWRTYLNYWIVILHVIRCNIIKREETPCSLIGLPTHFLSVMAKWISSHLGRNQAQLGWAPDSVTATWVCTLGVRWLWLNDQSRLLQIKQMKIRQLSWFGPMFEVLVNSDISIFGFYGHIANIDKYFDKNIDRI